MLSKLDWLQSVGKEDCLELYRAAARICHIGAWAVELSNGKTILTVEAAEILGIDQPISARRAIRMFVPEHRRVLRYDFRNCIQSGTPFSQTIRLVQAGGNSLWVRLTGEAVRNQGGKVIRVQGAIQDISQQKALEASLEQSELHFRDFANTIPFILWTAAPNGDVDYSNRAFMEYTGIPESAPPESRWQPIVHADDLPGCLDAWMQCVATGEPYRVEMRLRRGTDHQYRWFRVHALPVYDRNGLIRKWYGIGLDIHEMKSVSAQLSALAAEQQSFLESISDAFFSVDLHWRFRYLNHQAEEVFGKSAAELIGLDLWQILPKMRDSKLESALLQTQNERVTREVEVFFPSSEKWYLIRAYPAEGGISVFLIDVTQRRVTQERLMLFSRVASDVLYDWNLITGKVWRGDKFFDTYACEKTSRIGLVDDWSELIHPNDRETVMASLKAAINSGASRWESQYRIDLNDGGEIYVLDRATIVRSSGGEAIRVVGGMSDVTERIRAENEVRALNADLERRVAERTARLEFINQELESFSYSVSHDLRAPLRAMRGFGDILVREYSELLDSEGQRITRVIRDEADRMGRMISELLEFSRMGRVNFSRNPCDMNQMAQRAFKDIPQEERRHITDYRVSSLPTVQADASMLQLVWQNVISNAVKFSRRSRSAIIAVDCVQRETEFQFSIVDNGVGFDPKLADKIFDVFQRFHRSEAYEGTGIGLAIVRRVIQRHGGRVWAESNPGNWTKLTFTLPLKEPATGTAEIS